jgi:peptidoglycan/LPS O-acetylase OafA/YrhL
MTQTQPQPVATTTPSARDAPADRARFPCFDGYRAIAAMSVLLFHAGFYADFTFRDHPLGLAFLFARLEIGVAIFFLVSGFLLYRPFAAAHLDRRPAPDVRSYARRRLLRILPAYWAALTVGAFVLNYAPDVRTLRGFPIFYGLVQIYIPGRAVEGLGQAWSLCTELSFYAFLPLYAWMLGRKRRAPRRQLHAELTGLLGLYFGSFLFRLFTDAFYSHRAEMKFWLPANTDLFALGMGLAVVSAWFARRGTRPHLAEHRAFPAASWALAAVAFWVVSIPLDLQRHPFGTITFGQDVARQTLYGLVALFLLLPGVFGPQDRGGIRRFLKSRTVRFVGLVSYGIYLWHIWIIEQIIRWMGLPARGTGQWMRDLGRGDTANFPVVLVAGALLTVAVAALSYYIVERPFLRVKGRASAGR